MADRQISESKPGKNKTIPVIIFLSFAALIIAFAFVMEYINKQKADVPEPNIFSNSSKIQSEINELDWIIPMPLTINEYSRPGTPLGKVTGIVIHYIGNPGTTAEQNRNFFENLAVNHTTSVSSNFIIDIDGTIIQCVPVDEVAYATGIRNSDTLSIEVCHPDDTGEFTRESYAAVVRLTAWLCSRYDLTSDDVLRHYDVTGKECPRYYVEHEDAWERLLDDIHNEIRFQE